MKKGNYYLGRVVKLGILTQEMFINTLLDSPIIEKGKYLWAITDVEDHRKHSIPYIYGELSKFDHEGSVTKVDTSSKSKINELAENLLIASSPFVYLPEFSGIAYLHVWNQIQEDVFPRRLASIVEEAHQNFFVTCKIEAVSDYGDFITRISKITQFSQISAKVHPPNPLFGRLWKSLEKYIRERNATELSIQEEGDVSGLKTKIGPLMQQLLDDHSYSPSQSPSLTDTALLMAADGYGQGKVVGISNNKTIIVRTSDTKKSFPFSKDPIPDELAIQAWKEFVEINEKRDMDHS